MLKFALPFAAAGLLAFASPASALIIISTGPNVVPTDEEVLYGNHLPPSFTIEGFTDLTNTGLTATAGETLTTNAGQARVQPTDGHLDTPFTYQGFTGQLLGFDLTNPAKAFTSTEFRILKGTASQVTLTFVDTAGQAFAKTFAFPHNGFFNAIATNGELIDYFTVSANGSLGGARQIRLGGITDIPPVPEPVGWALMVLGFGGLGGLLRRRRAQQAIA